jgi:hypothetical protein
MIGFKQITNKSSIEASYDIMHLSKEQYYLISIVINNINLNKFDSFQINSFSSSLHAKEIWLLIKEQYIILKNLDLKIIQELHKGNIVFDFIDENKKTLIKFNQIT